MKYLVDVGNSTLKGAAQNDISQVLTTNDVKMFCATIRRSQVDGIVYSSVRPGLGAAEFERLVRLRVIDAATLVHKLTSCTFGESLDIGVDRKLACVAARRLLGVPTFAIVTSGTASTISFVRDGHCEESYIWPGLSLSLQAIRSNTRIADAVLSPADQVPRGRPKTLRDSVLLGVLGVTARAIQSWMLEFRREQGGEVPLVITGGSASRLVQWLDIPHTHLPDLTLHGLAEVAEIVGIP